MLPRRACLSVPGSEIRMVEKAASSGADEIVIDLEDSVPAGAKRAAREEVLRTVSGLPLDGPAIAVRVNSPGTPWCHEDVAAVAGASGRIWGIVVPKVESPGDLQFIERLLDGTEAAAGRRERLGVEALLESAQAIEAADAIAGASSRLTALILGYADLAASLGLLELPPDQVYWLPLRARVLVAARAHGLQAIDGPSLTPHLDSAFADQTRVVRDLGWDGRWAIHPRQVPDLIAAFTPSRGHVEWAHRVIEALESAGGEGRGALVLDGEMIDEAVRRRAAMILDRASDQ